MVPTYRGLAIFGSICTVKTVENARAGTMGGTFGSPGLEPGNDGGGRGGSTTILGTLAGAGPLGLAAAEDAVRSFCDGEAGDFVDTLGVTWPSVLITSFQPLGQVRQDATGQYFRAFSARLTHLP